MKDLFSVSLQDVMSPALLAVWERMSIGVAIVDADGICVFMNDIQRKVDGFSQTRVVGKHITQLYLPNGMSCVPTIECLRRGEPLLRKAYWYKTVNNSLFSSVSDFIPLFKNRVRDGVLTFTIWMDSTLLTGTGTHSAAGGAGRGGQPLAGEKLRYDFASIIGQDTVLRGSIADAQEAAKSTVPVMIWGENGTGKELFAQALHADGEHGLRAAEVALGVQLMDHGVELFKPRIGRPPGGLAAARALSAVFGTFCHDSFPLIFKK